MCIRDSQRPLRILVGRDELLELRRLFVNLFFRECHVLPPEDNKNFSALKKPPCCPGVLFRIPADGMRPRISAYNIPQDGGLSVDGEKRMHVMRLRICRYLFYHIQQNNTRAIFSFFAKNHAFYCFARLVVL